MNDYDASLFLPVFLRNNSFGQTLKLTLSTILKRTPFDNENTQFYYVLQGVSGVYGENFLLKKSWNDKKKQNCSPLDTFL